MSIRMKHPRCWKASTACSAAAMLALLLCSCSLFPQEEKKESDIDVAPVTTTDNGNASNNANMTANATGPNTANTIYEPEPTDENTPGTDTQITGLDNVVDTRCVAAIDDVFTGNTVYCAPMQICWNNAMGLIGGPFTSPTGAKSVELLNAQAFTVADVRPEYYYAYSGKVEEPDAVYTEITNTLQQRFNESSELLTPQIVEEARNSFLFYSMLFHEFHYASKFATYTNGYNGEAGFGSPERGNLSTNVEYFRIKNFEHGTVEQYAPFNEELDVLYHASDDDCAIMLRTFENDNIIIVKNPQGKTGQEMLVNAMARAAAYTGGRKLVPGERLEVPTCDFSEQTTYEELEHAYGLLPDGSPVEVAAAGQKTKLVMNEEGGVMKSEAYMTVVPTSAIDNRPANPPGRNFIFDDTYAVFFVDGSIHPGADFANQKPYFAMLVSDIAQIQPQAEHISPEAAAAAASANAQKREEARAAMNTSDK